MKKLFSLAAVLLLIGSLTAQNEIVAPNLGVGPRLAIPQPIITELTLLADDPAPLPADGWRWGVTATTFLRDAAFSLPYTLGYTATGFFLDPYAQYTLNQQVRLTAGVHMAGVAGYDGLRKWQPLVRMEYIPNSQVRLVMGTLYGPLSHRLYEPMLDRERYIYDHQEEGVQLRVDTRYFWSDTWLHWENLLEPWQADQERFTLATSNGVRVTRRMTIPFSFLGSHRGGQFSALDTCIESLFNESMGVRFDWPLNQRERVRVMIEVPFFWYQDVSPTKCQAFDNGWAVWPQLTYTMHFSGCRLVATAGYWYGHQWIAPRGSYLFQSVSWRSRDLTFPDREMATMRVAAEYKPWEQFSLGADAEGYYDIREAGLDFVFGVYMKLEI